MKTILSLFLLSISLMTAGCYSNSTKEAGSDSGPQSTPTRSDRY